MRALVFDGEYAHYTTDYPQPVADFAANECLIQVELAAVCNTDREILRGYRPDFQGVMGHEFVGRVKASPDPSLLGQRVVGELNFNCGKCLYCTTGRPHHCENRGVLGIGGHDGVFADYVTHRLDLLHPVPATLAPEVAVFTEPLAAALRISEQLHIPPSVQVALIGDGRLALMIGQIIALTGASLTVIGKSREKLSHFASFAHTLTEPAGDYEIVIEATGSPSGLVTALALTRSGGTLVVKSTYAGTVEVNMSEVVVRELTLVGSRCGPFKPALTLLERGLVKLPSLELHQPKDFQAAFNSKAFKAALDFRC